MDGTQLKYWDGGSASATNTAGLLSDGNGQCGAWAEFFIDMLKVQGISSNKIEVLEASDPRDRAFLVKNYTFTGTGVSPGTAPYVYVLGIDVIDASGVAGQGNSDPISAFYNHFIVSYSGQYYDPSYGSGPFGSQSEWENASLDGFTKSGFYGGVLRTLAKKNNTSLIETIFTP
jgi:hypothetical protein